MKKIILFLLLIFFYSCSEETTQITLEEKPGKTLKFWGDGKYDVLGHGYDITEGYMEPVAIKSKVLNIEKLAKDNRITPFNLMNATSYKHYSGKDITDITQKMSVDVCVDILGGFFGGFNAKFSRENEYKRTEAFSYYSFEVLNSKYEINTIPRELNSYFDSYFDYALNNWTPEEIVDRYGTHMLMNVLTGAKLDSYVMCDTESERQHDVANAAMAVTFTKAFGLDVNFQYDRNALKQSRYTRFVYETRGGKTELKESGVKDIDNESLTEFHVDLSNWMASTSTSTPIFLRTDGNKGLIPLYELINDVNKKEKLKNYINSYIKSKLPEVGDISPLGGVREVKTPFQITSGVGAAFGDIDKNGKLDLVLMTIEDREYENDGLNYYHYQILYDVDEYGNSSRKSEIIKLQTNMITWGNVGGSIAIADLNNNGISDIIFLSADIGLTRPVKFYYQVAFDVSPSGKPRTITGRYSVGDILNSYGSRGVGIDLYDFNKNGIPDMLLSIYDETGNGKSHFRYKICYDIGTNGAPSGAQSQGYKLPVTMNGRMGQGSGASIGDINKNGKPDLLLMFIDDLGAVKYNVIYDLDKNGNTFSPILSYSPELTSYDIGLNHQGADCAIADLDKDGNLDILFVTMYHYATGANSWRYILGSNLKPSGVPQFWR